MTSTHIQTVKMPKNTEPSQSPLKTSKRFNDRLHILLSLSGGLIFFDGLDDGVFVGVIRGLDDLSLVAALVMVTSALTGDLVGVVVAHVFNETVLFSSSEIVCRSLSLTAVMGLSSAMPSGLPGVRAVWDFPPALADPFGSDGVVAMLDKSMRCSRSATDLTMIAGSSPSSRQCCASASMKLVKASVFEEGAWMLPSSTCRAYRS